MGMELGQNWTDNITEILSLVSVLIAFATLYFSILKKGKPKIHLFVRPGEYEVHRSRAYKDIPVDFSVRIPALIRNIGANPTAVSNIKWDLETTGAVQANVSNPPKFINPDTSLCSLAPYEQILRILILKVNIEEKKAEWQDDLSKLRAYLDTCELRLRIKYRSYEGKKTRHCQMLFDLTPMLRNIVLGK